MATDPKAGGQPGGIAQANPQFGSLPVSQQVGDGGGFLHPMEAAMQRNQANRSQMFGFGDKRGQPFGRENFDINTFLTGLPPAAMSQFQNSFNTFDNLPMQQQLSWMANLFGGNNAAWQKIIDGFGGGVGAQPTGGML